ncbi:hypothetical protein L3V82_10480 [Thiotrichales bacterium 19S3-7]|nr:hypothetical protein [Thiotrichales bacterium 19S3-7]MCF6802583.1 hypothetical protein [Thiotrichales bacterium 19S3-11]
MKSQLTKGFLQLKETNLEEIPHNNTSIYGQEAIYYNQNNIGSFNQAKAQICILIDKIISCNPTALADQMNQLKDNIKDIKNNDTNEDKQRILYSLKKELESIYYYQSDKLKTFTKDQIQDLTFNACYEGAYSNSIMFRDRLIGGSLSAKLIHAKKEAIRQLAADFLHKNKLSNSGMGIHDTNQLYNHVCQKYGLNPIPDQYNSLSHNNKVDFIAYLDENLTASLIITQLRSNNFIPDEANNDGLTTHIEPLLPDAKQQDRSSFWSKLFNKKIDNTEFNQTWRQALYTYTGNNAFALAKEHSEVLKDLFLEIILQRAGFITNAVRAIQTNDTTKPTLYQTEQGLFIKEITENDELGIEYTSVRIVNETDISLIKQYLSEFDQSTPLWFLVLPKTVLTNLIDGGNINYDDYFKPYHSINEFKVFLDNLPKNATHNFFKLLKADRIESIAKTITNIDDFLFVANHIDTQHFNLLLNNLNKPFINSFSQIKIDILRQLDHQKIEQFLQHSNQTDIRTQYYFQLYQLLKLLKKSNRKNFEIVFNFIIKQGLLKKVDPSTVCHLDSEDIFNSEQRLTFLKSLTQASLNKLSSRYATEGLAFNFTEAELSILSNSEDFKIKIDDQNKNDWPILSSQWLKDNELETLLINFKSIISSNINTELLTKSIGKDIRKLAIWNSVFPTHSDVIDYTKLQLENSQPIEKFNFVIASIPYKNLSNINNYINFEELIPSMSNKEFRDCFGSSHLKNSVISHLKIWINNLDSTQKNTLLVIFTNKIKQEDLNKSFQCVELFNNLITSFDDLISISSVLDNNQLRELLNTMGDNFKKLNWINQQDDTQTELANYFIRFSKYTNTNQFDTLIEKFGSVFDNQKSLLSVLKNLDKTQCDQLLSKRAQLFIEHLNKGAIKPLAILPYFSKAAFNELIKNHIQSLNNDGVKFNRLQEAILFINRVNDDDLFKALLNKFESQISSLITSNTNQQYDLVDILTGSSILDNNRYEAFIISQKNNLNTLKNNDILRLERLLTTDKFQIVTDQFGRKDDPPQPMYHHPQAQKNKNPFFERTRT